MWTDAHCHLSDKRLVGRLEEDLNQAKALGITRWVLGGIHPEDWQSQEELRQRFPGSIYTSYGLHPWWISESQENEIETAYQKLNLMLPEANALGELGLDFGKRFTLKETQKKQTDYFEKQLGLLQTCAKPLVLHVVEAHAEALALLKKHGCKGGIVHSFSAGTYEAEEYMKLGLTLSISGVITRAGYKRLKEAAKTLPKDKIVIETDCPDQKPLGAEEGLNLPKNLLLVAKALAEIRKETTEEVLRYTTENMKKVLSL